MVGKRRYCRRQSQSIGADAENHFRTRLNFSPFPKIWENGRVCRLKYRADISDGIFTGSGGRKVETAKCPKLPKMETHI
ncbi:hypothetical protein COI25_01245 [Neisseria meningitidis]|nr:hypothetical protein [Neisseria meningitidis]MBJ7810216.1 hypothetical protein [Neisseria meningitidis]RNK11842.1 hypothetical protein COI25_01245 [Neisseria meningitidis]RQK59781.1 hypothetical protein COH63_00610 [Neisseria meningitidis]RQK80268.1 hypothetical protein COH53_03790 [Neisseria meningitidis]